MASYRAYLLNPEGRITIAEWLDSKDDDAALDDAHGLCSAERPRAEVWLGSRRVGAAPREQPARPPA